MDNYSQLATEFKQLQTILKYFQRLPTCHRRRSKHQYVLRCEHIALVSDPRAFLVKKTLPKISYKVQNKITLLAFQSFPPISLSYAMRPGLQIRHFWVAKSLFLTITFHQKKQDKTFCF